jgi:hypothetical protein
MATITFFDLDWTASGLNEAVSYTEGSGAVLLAQNALLGAMGNFNGQTLTVSGLLADDEIGFAGGVTIAGNAIRIGAITIGTFAGGSGGANFIVTFNSNATAGRVQTLIRNLTYRSTDDSPTPVHALTINLAGTTRTDTVTAVPVNDAPVVDLNGAAAGTSAALEYDAGGPLTAIAPTGTIADIDSANFGGGTLRVSFAANGTSTDQLRIITGGGVTLTGLTGMTVRINGVAIGTLSGGVNGADLLIFLNTGATQARVQTLMEHIGYMSSSGAPSTLSRTVTFTLNDGDGTANGGQNIGTASATITVTGNEPPQITSDGGGDSASKSVAENTTAVTTVTATDPNPGATLTYSFVTVGDFAKFTLNPSTGALAFITAPDFENPADAGADNTYNVTVRVTDGSLTDTQALTVTVQDVEEEVHYVFGTPGDDVLNELLPGVHEILLGDLGNDTLFGGVEDVLDGGGGDDQLLYNGNKLIGGDGFDTLLLQSNLDLGLLINTEQITGIEQIDMSGGFGSDLMFTSAQVRDLSDETDDLFVRGDAGDVIHNFGTDWSSPVRQTIDGVEYDVYTVGAQTLYVEALVSVFPF